MESSAGASRLRNSNEKYPIRNNVKISEKLTGILSCNL